MNAIKITGVSLALLIAGCAATQVPQALKPDTNQRLALVVHAKGEQIYECRERKDQPADQPVAYDWAFVAPQAGLFDGNGKQIGKHYAGPSWEAADGSKIVGKVRQAAAAPAAGNIPWLLLEAKSAGKDGAFSKITSVQRVATAGGMAPPNGCPLAGYRVEIPYTADYYFFTAK